MGKDTHRENNPHWKGGRYVNDAGYQMAYNPGHLRAGSNGYVREHIVLAEKTLGKPLPEGVHVHHYGEIGDNSKIVICQDAAYHSLIHIRTRAYKACGNANYRKCKFCQQYDDPKNMYVKQVFSNGQSDGWNCYHRECENADQNKRKTGFRKQLPKGAQIYYYDNDADNSEMVICQNKKYRCLLRIRAKAFATSGNANYRKCRFCQKYDDPGNMYIRQMKNGGWQCWHRKCYNEYKKKRRANKCSN